MDGLYIRPLDQLEGRAVVGTETGGWPFVSPDGQWIGFVDQRTQLRKVPILGGPSQLIAELPNFVQGAVWQEDGMILVSISRQGLFRISSDGGPFELIRAPDADAGESALFWPDPLPDGRGVVYTLETEVQGSLRWQVAVLDLATGESKSLTSSGSFGRYLPSGHLVYLLDGTVMAVPFDLERLEIVGTPLSVLEEVEFKQTGAADFAVNGDGSMVYVTGSRSLSQRSLVWIDRDGRVEDLPIPQRSWQFPAVSPDGSRLAVAAVDDGRDIWIWDFERATLQRLTEDPGLDMFPSWGPDGAEIYFYSSRRDFMSLFRRDASGFRPAEEVFSADTYGRSSYARFTPDGRSILRSSPREGGLVIDQLDGSGTEVLIPPGPTIVGAILSPDGEWLAYASDESGQPEIYLRPFPEVEQDRIQVSTDGGTVPRWSADGSEVLFRGGGAEVAESGRSMMAASVAATGGGVEVGRPRKLFDLSFPTDPYYGLDPAGGRFLFVRIDDEAVEDWRLVLVQNWFEELERLVPAG